jgi:hypothetical protein
MDLTRLEPDRLGRLRARATDVEERSARSRVLLRILGVLGITLDDVVNCPLAKRKALGLYRVASACEWEGQRTRLLRRAAEERWIREQR